MKLFPPLFTFLLILLVLNVQGQNNDAYISVMVERLEHAKKYSLDMAHAMPEERYVYKPTETEMSFGKQLIHMAQNIEMICTRYLKVTNNAYDAKLTVPETGKELIVARLSNAFDLAISTVKNLDPASLSDEVDFFAGKKNKMQMVNLINDHQAHHRGQLIVYLRLNAIAPPAYIGW
jgi:uncharacterized damage-inducible protein DinB